MSRVQLAKFKCETPPTLFCERDFRPDPALISSHDLLIETERYTKPKTITCRGETLCILH